MALDVAGLKLVAERLISENGNSAVLTHNQSSGSYDPQTGTYTVIPTNYNYKAYISNPSTRELEKDGVGRDAWSSIHGTALLV